MQKARLVLFIAVITIFCWALGRQWGGVPPLGKLLDPFHGFWQNAEYKEISFKEDLRLPGLKGKAEVAYDARRVPHIFAENEHDLFFLQGYVTARDRLFQMDVQTRAAAGRLAEIIPDSALIERDRYMRRMGLAWAAENSLAFMQKDPKSKLILEAYAKGVNTYINSLNYKSLPFEYKLLNFEPEAWSPLRSAILLKMMAFNLTSRNYDIENTATAHTLGIETFLKMYPQIPDSIAPIVQQDTGWNFDVVAIDTPAQYTPEKVYGKLSFEQPHPNNGSNNWAVSGKKTASGYPMLSNDPHLGLQLPSFWYEVQLHGPEINVYGVSLPGAPMVVIGFNKEAAWGLTNGARDVLDWYKINFDEKNPLRYQLGNSTQKAQLRVEKIKIKGKPTLVDTVKYTVHGPVTYDENFSEKGLPTNLALRWKAHDPSNELMTFYLLNKATNYEQYRAALRHFECPGQNFVFASKTGDIALTQQGKFPVRWPHQGEFVLDGSDSLHLWQAYIPFAQNPVIKNPECGFVVSANQHAADSAYPYSQQGRYEYYRNRRIRKRLGELSRITLQDLQQLQNDNFNLMAAENLPLLLSYLQESKLNEVEKKSLLKLKSWNFLNLPNMEAPALFESWLAALQESIWLDELKASPLPSPAPAPFLSFDFIRKNPEHPFYDDRSTEEKEGLAEVITLAFQKGMQSLEEWKKENNSKGDWQSYNHVNVRHLLRKEPLGYENIKVGGNYSIVNANHDRHGASWRMIIELGPQPKGWGIYPGGISGNPGSYFYDNAVSDWARGRYYPLLLLDKSDKTQEEVYFVQKFTGK